MKENIKKIIEIPEGVDVKIDGKVFIKGPKGEMERKGKTDFRGMGQENGGEGF